MMKKYYHFLLSVSLTVFIGLATFGCHENNPEPVNENNQQQEQPQDTTHQSGDITYQLQQNAYFLPDSALNHISKWEPDSSYMYGDICSFGSFHVDACVPKSMFPPVGSSEKFIINKHLDVFPEGLIAGVNFIEDDKDGYTVHYYIVKLTDVFHNLHMDEQALSLNTHAKKIVNRNGKNIPFKIAQNASVDKYHLEIASEDLDLPLGFSLTPKMMLDLVLKMQMIIDEGQLYTFTSVLESDITFDAEISASLAGWGAETTFDICTVYFAAIPIGPLVITPSVEIVGIVGVEGELKIATEISYTEKFRSELHYDVNSGLSVSNNPLDNPSPFKCETQPKLSGAVKYGLGIGPTIGIYGKSIAVGFTLDCLLKDEIEWTGNFNDFDLTKASSLYQTYGNFTDSPFLDFGYNSKYIWSLIFKCSATLKGYGIDAFRASTPELKIELDNRVLLPNVSNTYTYEMEDNYLTFHTWLKGKAVSYPPIRLLFYNPYSQTFIVDDEFDFDFGEAQIRALESGADSVEITFSGLLSQEKKYNHASPAFEINGKYYPIPVEYNTSFDTHDSKYTKAIKAILKDIRACSAGDWEECNWDDPVSLSEMKYVQFRDYLVGGRKSLTITIPQEWELGSELKVDNHCEALIDSFYWNIEMYDLSHPFDKIEIQDPCCTYVLTGEDVNTLIMRCKVWDGTNRKLSYIPEQLKTLDISQSSLPHFTLPDNVHQLEHLNLDNCANLVSIYVCMHQNTTQISASNCAKLNDVTIDSLRSDFNWNYDCKTLTFRYASIGALSVNNLSRLQNLYCENAGLTSLNLSNLPKLTDLRCYNNPGLGGFMLPIFDEMFNRGAYPRYDQRYTYNPDGTVKSDLGYGFYYQGEPDRGYHRQY